MCRSWWLNVRDDETSWCSSFVNWVLKQTDIKGTNNAGALSWRDKWDGQKLDKPAYGALVVFDHGKGYRHVGFVAGIDEKNGRVIVMGGNQNLDPKNPNHGEIVNYKSYKINSNTRFVFPKGYEPNYNLPVMTAPKATGTDR